MDYEKFFEGQLSLLKQAGNYRHFAELERVTGSFPAAKLHKDSSSVQDIIVWCSNDYLGMGQHPKVIQDMQSALALQGAGAGGTRNISGTNHYHVRLEAKLAALHKKPAALIFTSGYVANYTTLSVLGRMIPNLIIYSDEMNHNSMIEGIRQSKGLRRVFRHNDVEDLENQLKADDPNLPKLVAFESIYSMDADIGKIREIQAIAEKYNALTFLDEVHAVGMYGDTGAGVAERDAIADRIDIIQGTLGKAFGVIGGYIASSVRLVDFVRSFGHGFIFTTALPPSVAAGAIASIDILSGSEGVDLRARQQAMASKLKARLKAANLPIMASDCHIVPVFIGDPIKCRAASKRLLEVHNIYVQSINYPTVPKGTERLRLTPTPHHSDEALDRLMIALNEVWGTLSLPALNKAA